MRVMVDMQGWIWVRYLRPGIPGAYGRGMTQQETLTKMNARYGTDHVDYYMCLVWLRRQAERLERKAKVSPDMYGDTSREAWADYIAALEATP